MALVVVSIPVFGASLECNTAKDRRKPWVKAHVIACLANGFNGNLGQMGLPLIGERRSEHCRRSGQRITPGVALLEAQPPLRSRNYAYQGAQQLYNA